MTRIVFPPDYGPTIPSIGDTVPTQTVGGALVVDPGVPLTSWQDPAALTMVAMFKRHPSVRKVTTFIADTLASIPLHVYERVGDTDRRRVTTGPLAELIAQPSMSPGVTPYRFWGAVIMDGLIFDRTCIWKQQTAERVELVRVPPSAWRVDRDGLGLVSRLQVRNGVGGWDDMDPGDFIIDSGYSTGAVNVPPLESLRIPVEDYLDEAMYRRDVWSKGPRFGGIVSRDTKWPNEEARTRFLSGLAMFNRAGARSGTTMLLDDGMKWADVQGVSPKDVASVDSRQYSDVEVASAFHIAPELVGAREGTFANVQAYRQGLYSLALAPYLTQWEQMLAPLAREYGTGAEYIEANVQAKLRGAFEEQAAQLQTSIGAPYMTRNEGRARLNLPALEGGDELVTPLNVLEGGQASPTDSAPPPKAAAVAVKVAAVPAVKADGGVDDEDRADVEAVLCKFWKRQKATVVAAAAAGDEWWDKARWDKELAADLLDAAIALSTDVGRRVAKDLGEAASAYSVARTIAYLTKVTAARAEWINDTTRDQVAESLASDDEDDTPGARFDYAIDNRAAAAAGAFTAGIAGFATREAAMQTGNTAATKTWVVTSGSPRPSHAAMDGETVRVGERFSNGMAYPGDPEGGADEVAGCMCSLVINRA